MMSFKTTTSNNQTVTLEAKNVPQLGRWEDHDERYPPPDPAQRRSDRHWDLLARSSGCAELAIEFAEGFAQAADDGLLSSGTTRDHHLR